MNAASSNFDKWELKDRLDLADALTQANRLNKAETLYLMILDSLQKNPPKESKEAREAYIDIAHFYIRKNDDGKAEKYYKEALSIPRSNISSLEYYETLEYELGRFYLARKNYAEAEIYYTEHGEEPKRKG